MLFLLDPAEIDLVAAVREIERHQRERHQRLAGELLEQHEPRRYCGADEISRRTPQKALVPDLDDRPVGRECDRCGDENRVDDEVGRGGGPEGRKAEPHV